MYHQYLNLPFGMSRPKYSIPDLTKRYHCRIEREDINSDLLDWFSDRHIEGHPTMPGEFFYTPPFDTLWSHSDCTEIIDVVKLNWMWGGEGSFMDWYELKPGATFHSNDLTSPTGKHGVDRVTETSNEYAPGYAHAEDLDLNFSATIGTPSLVNVGRIHGVRNMDQPRFISCFIPVWKNNHKRLMWPEAIELFKKYIVK